MTTRTLLGFASALLLSGCLLPAQQPQPPPVSQAVTSPPRYAKIPQPPPPPPKVAAPPDVDMDFLHAYTASRRFTRGVPRSPVVLPDGSAVLFLRSATRDSKQSLFELDLALDKVSELLSPDAIDKGPEQLTQEERARRERMRITSNGFTSFSVSEDGRTVIVILSGKLYAFSRATKKITRIDTGKLPAIDPRLSPDGKLIAYVQFDDLHVVNADGTGKARAITKGGSEAKTHGLADFVASEELDRYRGYYWSPDSKSILYEEADTSGVEQFTIADPAHPENPAEKFPYPRAGHNNAVLKFGIVKISGGETKWLDWDRAQFCYVAQVEWSPGAPPTLVVFDRLQKNELVLAGDEKSGKTRELVREHDDAWVNGDPSVPRWLPDGSGFLWTSERDGDWRLGFVPVKDAKGAKADPSAIQWLTPKGMQVRGVSDLDGKNRVATFEETADGLHHAALRVSLDGGAPTVLGKLDDGNVGAQFSEHQHDIYISIESSVTGLHRSMIRSIDKKLQVELPSLADNPLPPHVDHEDVGPDHVHVAIVRPRSYIEGVKYPLIDSAYGGPHVQVVSLDPRAYLFNQWMADATGAIVVSIDSQGTPGRGRAWERVLSGKLGAVPIDGHARVIQALAASHPEIDGTRVGVFGWSFGGYFSALAVLSRSDVYSAGVAIAPVVDWRDYDTAYTERYLGLPQDNAGAYDAASVLTYAKKPLAPGAREPALLIMHGTADDNVYFLNSMKLVEALELANRSFEFLPFLGQTHQIASPEDTFVVWTRAAKTLRDGLR